MPLERDFQRDLIKELKERYPEAYILKNDSGYIQGFPDITILMPGSWWAVLESKRSATAPYRPNQEYHLNKTGNMSFSATIYPENKEEVLNAMEQSYKRSRARKSRIS